jgi:NAD+ synthetase
MDQNINMGNIKGDAFMSKEVAQRTSDWIKQYASKAKVESLVVGISGGIDSAVVSTLCCMTGINTYLVSMPIRQNKEHLKRAHDHANDLVKRFSNVKSLELDLTEHFNLSETSLLSTELSLANTRSRLRMTMLYQVASNCMGIVVGTGNKIEDFGVGFFTKYGDGGVDISPIADFTKTEVRALAKELNIIEDQSSKKLPLLYSLLFGLKNPSELQESRMMSNKLKEQSISINNTNNMINYKNNFEKQEQPQPWIID